MPFAVSRMHSTHAAARRMPRRTSRRRSAGLAMESVKAANRARSKAGGIILAASLEKEKEEEEEERRRRRKECLE